VVDDNSPDGTYQQVCDTFVDDPRISAVLRTHDRGLANSIRAGVDRSTADYIIVMDTDFTHDPKEIPTLLHVLQIRDIVSGSRFCAGGRMNDLPHYMASLSYNWMLRNIAEKANSGQLRWLFRRTPREPALLPLDEIVFGYGDYFFRLSNFAQIAKTKVIEIPAEYLVRNLGESKSNWFKMLIMYTAAALRLRARTRKSQTIMKRSNSNIKNEK
jgi:dolichol-phosphate mannosyltransferase